MNRIISFSILILFSLCILGTEKPSIDIDDTNFHLNTYSEANKTHHDNIDDSVKEHTHTHKHSEDGEEHEHGHHHTKVAQPEAKGLNQVKYIEVSSREFDSTQEFIEKHMVSKPHLLRLFKPPIA